MSETTPSPTTVADDDTTVADDDLATLLARREHARPTRVTWVLLSLLLVAVGFAGGALAYRTWAPAATSSGGLPTGALPSAPMGGGGEGTSLADLTVGTVTLVNKDRLYLEATDGTTVVVTIPDGTAVTAQRQVALADLEEGATVIVRGEVAADGSVTATSVTEGSAGGGLPGFTPPTTTGGN